MDYRKRLMEMGLAARAAARQMALIGSAEKEAVLRGMAHALRAAHREILGANAKDMEAARGQGGTGAMLDRLLLDEKRISAMAAGLEEIAQLPDPVGAVEEEHVRPSGIRVARMRVPLGVIGMVYEARPNVTADAAGLCLKAGNAVILRGGSEAVHSNQAIVKVIQEAIAAVGLPAEAVQVVPGTDRAAVQELLRLDGYLDCVIPRGGKAFLQWVAATATVPVIRHGDGNCHVYIDASAPVEMAQSIAYNAKVQRPGVCNAMETLLVHHAASERVLPALLAKYRSAGVELRGCPRTQQLDPEIKAATEQDWATEYLDLILAIKIVDSMQEAVAHIHTYGSGHSEAIVTTDYFNAETFLRQVDAAAVLVNASTRLVDGAEFGLGAEVGISTQKLHARGPMGVRELTTTKFVVRGQGQVRA